LTARWSDEEQNKALAALSSLKRAMGIANVTGLTDHFSEHNLKVFTPDKGSADLVAELLFRYGNGKRAKFYDSRPHRLTIRDTIAVEVVGDGEFVTSMLISNPPDLARRLSEMVEKHISPDKNFSR
jgi:hypothetical protein